MRKAAFPRAEPFAVHALTASRRTGLGVVAEFVEEDVFDENPGYPGLVKLGMQRDGWCRTAAVAAEADMGLAAALPTPRPGHARLRRMREPGGVDAVEGRVQIEGSAQRLGRWQGDGPPRGACMQAQAFAHRAHAGGDHWEPSLATCPDPARDFAQRRQFVEQAVMHAERAAGAGITQADQQAAVGIQAHAQAAVDRRHG